MDIYEETKQPLKDIWDNEDSRQKAKLVILKAISTTTELSAKATDSIFDEMDSMLLDDKEEIERTAPKGL